MSQNDCNENLFLAVHHITSSIDCVRVSPQRDNYRAICRLAAQRARLTGDYASAVRYLRTARLLKEDALITEPDEDFTLAFEEAECEFLQGNLPSALTLCHQLLRAPGSLQQKAVTAGMMAEVQMRQSDMGLALETALAWLAVFGIHLSRAPTDAECDEAWQRIEARIGDDPAKLFRQLARIDNPEAEAVINLMLSASMFSAFTAPRLHFLLLCRIILMTLEHGFSGAFTTAIAW